MITVDKQCQTGYHGYCRQIVSDRLPWLLQIYDVRQGYYGYCRQKVSDGRHYSCYCIQKVSDSYHGYCRQIVSDRVNMVTVQIWCQTGLPWFLQIDSVREGYHSYCGQMVSELPWLLQINRPMTPYTPYFGDQKELLGSMGLAEINGVNGGQQELARADEGYGIMPILWILDGDCRNQLILRRQQE